jgi:hypothetical protein
MHRQPVPAPAHHDLEEVIDHIIALCLRNGPAHEGHGRVSVADLMDMLGERSFGPLLLVPSLIAVSPVGAIPGLPAITSVVIVLIAGQILLGHEHFWIPGLAGPPLDRCACDGAGAGKFRPVARFIDHLLRPRMAWLTQGPAFYAIALLCLLIGLVTPILELVPLGGIPPNAAVVAFSLAITARDGAVGALGLRLHRRQHRAPGCATMELNCAKFRAVSRCSDAIKAQSLCIRPKGFISTTRGSCVPVRRSALKSA